MTSNLRLFLACSFLLACALPATAETVVRIYPPGEEPPRLEAVRDHTSPAAVTAVASGVNVPTSFYIVPSFKVDLDNPAGLSTLFAVRNEADTSTQITVEYFGSTTFTPIDSETVDLDPLEVFTRNVRDTFAGQTGEVRGWIRITADGQVTADYFVVTPGEAFAVGAVPIDIDNGGFCKRWRSRFLIGGGFSGGTQVSFMLNLPLGMSEPSVRGTAYTEEGVEINTFTITTDEVSFDLPAQSFVLPGNNFGSFTFEFQGGARGVAFDTGAVFTTHDASGQFSVGVEGHCLDFSPPLL